MKTHRDDDGKLAVSEKYIVTDGITFANVYTSRWWAFQVCDDLNRYNPNMNVYIKAA